MASPVDTSVKFALSSMAGAPTINGQPGSRISAIRAFAVTGFGIKAVDAGGTISGGKCRLAFGSGASAAVVNSVILVAGATPAALNGEQKVTAVASGWVEFATDLPDGAVTGTVTFKIAPLGWEEVYSKTNVSVFRPTDPASSRPYYRIDDSNTTYAIVQMYESMTDVDTGTNGTPERYWAGRTSAVATASAWVFAGDSRGMHYAVAPNATGATDFKYTMVVWYFGDQVSDKSGDAYPAVLMAAPTVAASGSFLFFQAYTDNYVMRIAAGVGGAVQTEIRNEAQTGQVSGADTTMGSFPSRAAQALILTPIAVADGGTLVNTGRRGRIPGAMHCPQSGIADVLGRAVSQVVGAEGSLGKTMMAVPVGGTNTSGVATGLGFIDITGPWRQRV